MAGTVTRTTHRANGKVLWTLEWTADESGAVSGHALELPDLARIYQAKIVHGDAETGYSVTLVDGDALDILGGQGAALVTASGTRRVVMDPHMHGDGDTLDLVISGAGSGASGTVKLVLERNG